MCSFLIRGCGGNDSNLGASVHQKTETGRFIRNVEKATGLQASNVCRLPGDLEQGGVQFHALSQNLAWYQQRPALGCGAATAIGGVSGDRSHARVETNVVNRSTSERRESIASPTAVDGVSAETAEGAMWTILSASCVISSSVLSASTEANTTRTFEGRRCKKQLVEEVPVRSGPCVS